MAARGYSGCRFNLILQREGLNEKLELEKKEKINVTDFDAQGD